MIISADTKSRVLLIGAVFFVIICSSYIIFFTRSKFDAKPNSPPEAKPVTNPTTKPTSEGSEGGSSSGGDGGGSSSGGGGGGGSSGGDSSSSILKSNYKLIMHESAVTKIEEYKEKLALDSSMCGRYLKNQLNSLFEGIAIKDLTTNQFIEALLATKLPKIYAEGQSFSSSSGWSPEDARLLGNINVVMPVKIFDNGQWSDPNVHATPFEGYLMYTPGALLTKDCNVDHPVIVKPGGFDEDAYFDLYERRLLPLFHFANDESFALDKKAIVTVPGIGCGAFSGGYNVTSRFNSVLKKILAKHAANLPNISLVYFGENASSFGKAEFEAENFDGIKYRRINSKHEDFQNLLEPPEKFKIDATEDYSDHLLFAFVAWDHISLPGNDFFVNSRYTDDGVKAAATSSMTSLLAVEGEYHAKNLVFPSEGFKYKPKLTPETNWEDIAKNIKFRLQPTEGALYVLKTGADGKPVLTNE